MNATSTTPPATDPAAVNGREPGPIKHMTTSELCDLVDQLGSLPVTYDRIATRIYTLLADGTWDDEPVDVALDANDTALIAHYAARQVLQLNTTLATALHRLDHNTHHPCIHQKCGETEPSVARSMGQQSGGVACA